MRHNSMLKLRLRGFILGTTVGNYEDTYGWLSQSGEKVVVPHLVLGNGFSIAQNPKAFSYLALRDRALQKGQISPLAQRLFTGLNTPDFESVIEACTASARTLRILRDDPADAEAEMLDLEASKLKEALAVVLAGLHPERPSDVDESAYRRVYRFLARFNKIYTMNYDLLLYWALMKGQDPDFANEVGGARVCDDGFRDPGHDSSFVTWDHLHSSRTQCVYYLHGALHIFRNAAGLQKHTWSRTDIPLIDQIRAQLDSGYFPLYVSEGTSAEKLTRIHSSDYLARGLRSLAETRSGMLVFGLSFSPNDEHLIKAIVESGILRLAISMHGDPKSEENLALMRRGDAVKARRIAYSSKRPLEVRFFDSQSVPLWDDL